MQIAKPYVSFNEEERRLYNIVEAFCNTLIAPSLKGSADPEQYEKLLALLQDPSVNIRTGRKSPDTTTFGDFAVLLAEPTHPQEASDDLIATYFTACELFFACFEPHVKDSMPQSVRDFMDMPFDTFFHFAELCSTFPKTLPKACTKRREAYNTKGKTVAELYDEVYETCLNGDKTQIVSLITLFAVPLAMIQLY